MVWYLWYPPTAAWPTYSDIPPGQVDAVLKTHEKNIIYENNVYFMDNVYDMHLALYSTSSGKAANAFFPFLTGEVYAFLTLHDYDDETCVYVLDSRGQFSPKLELFNNFVDVTTFCAYFSLARRSTMHCFHY